VKVNKICLRSVFSVVNVILCLGVVKEVVIHKIRRIIVAVCHFLFGISVLQDALPITKDRYTNGVGLLWC
jgi:hypothetical protein